MPISWKVFLRQAQDRLCGAVLRLRSGTRMRPGITGPATLKYRLEDDMLASLRLSPEGKSVTDWQGKVYDMSKSFPLGGELEEAAI